MRPGKAYPGIGNRQMPKDYPLPWLDGEGVLLRGKYKGQTVEGMVRDDPGYAQWIVEGATAIDEEDRRIIETLLRRQEG